MANGLNRVTLFGNVGADPELRVTPSGQSVLKIRLATTESYLDKNRVRQEKTEWHSVVVWGKRAESLGKFIEKGSRLLVEGSISYRSYEKQDGSKGYSTDITAQEVILAGGAGAQRQSAPASDNNGDLGGEADDFPAEY